MFAKEKSGKCNTYPSHASRLVTETGFRSANNNNQIDERYNFHPFTAPHLFFRFHFDRCFFFLIFRKVGNSTFFRLHFSRRYEYGGNNQSDPGDVVTYLARRYPDQFATNVGIQHVIRCVTCNMSVVSFLFVSVCVNNVGKPHQ